METHRLKCASAPGYRATRKPVCGCAACNIKWLHAQLSIMSARVLTLEKKLRPRRLGPPYDAGRRRR